MTNFGTELKFEGSSQFFKNWYWLLMALLFVTLILLLTFVYVSNPPRQFPVNQPVMVEKGSSASAIAKHMQKAKVVKSDGLLYAVLVLLHDPSKISAGPYIFDTKVNVFQVAGKLAKDVPQANLVTLTFPEGYSVKDYSQIISQKLIDFDVNYFYVQANPYEGFLFPDTYYVPPEYSEDELIELLRNAYKQKTEIVRPYLESNKLTEEGVITLASIVEREANTPESMKIVAGILLSRMNLGMPLQADASMEYVLDKSIAELTAEDLDIDSPYNTYFYKGLPPTPIGNPGLGAIKAVLQPTETEYLYYLTDADGQFHYAETLAEHNQNIARYLR